MLGGSTEGLAAGVALNVIDRTPARRRISLADTKSPFFALLTKTATIA